MIANIETHINEMEKYGSISFRDRKARPTRSAQSQLTINGHRKIVLSPRSKDVQRL